MRVTGTPCGLIEESQDLYVMNLWLWVGSFRFDFQTLVVPARKWEHGPKHTKRGKEHRSALVHVALRAVHSKTGLIPLTTNAIMFVGSYFKAL